MQVLKAVLIITVLLAYNFAARGQDSLSETDKLTIQKIKESESNKSEAMELLSWLCDVHGQRLNWSPEFHNAAKWAAEKLKSWGLTNIHMEGFTPRGRGWTMNRFDFNILEPTQYPLIALPRAWSPSSEGKRDGEILIFEASSEEELEKYHGKLDGAFLLMDPPVLRLPNLKPDIEFFSDSALTSLSEFVPPSEKPKLKQRDSTAFRNALKEIEMNIRKTEFCINEGAAAFLYNDDNSGGTIRVHGLMVPQIIKGNDSSKHQEQQKNIPQIVISSEQYNRIYRTLLKKIKVKAEMQLDVTYTDTDSNYNLIADIPGTDLQDEIVLIGAHLDSWHAGTGATDNGTGVAAIMEAARLLIQNDIKPRRTIRLGLWGGEEMGLWGSRTYVYNHLAHWTKEAAPKDSNSMYSLKVKPEYYKFNAYFNYDNGAGLIRGMYLQGNKEARPIIDSWLAAFNDSLARTTTLITKGSSDQKPFNDVCLPSFLFIQDPLDYNTRTWHTNMDMVDKVPEENLKQAAAMIASMAWLAATREQLMPRKPVVYEPGEH